MFNVCPNCGLYEESKHIDPAGPYAICPACNHAHRFVYLPLYVITGASGAGKSTLALALPQYIPDFVFLEGDIFWRPEFNRPQSDYLDFRNVCLRAAKNINQSGRPAVLCGSATPGQYEACPEFRYFNGVHTLALVCNDDVLSRRLQERPSFRQSSSPEFITSMVNYNRWFKTNAAAHAITLLDTSALSIADTIALTRQWLHRPGESPLILM